MLKAGDKVTYIDINLREYVGEIKLIGSQGNGANCKVQWLQPRWLLASECLCNLVKTARTA